MVLVRVGVGGAAGEGPAVGSSGGGVVLDPAVDSTKNLSESRRTFLSEKDDQPPKTLLSSLILNHKRKLIPRLQLYAEFFFGRFWCKTLFCAFSRISMFFNIGIFEVFLA